MILIFDKSKCTGCGACVAKCPKAAIYFVYDDEGAAYPKVDQYKCIDCGLCEKVCPVMSDCLSRGENFEEEYFAAQLKDVAELFLVSSGGAFWALAKTIIDTNGVVYGATQNSDGTIEHKRADKLEDVMDFRRSKYLQSNCLYVYKETEIDLKKGKRVLFSGTGCQIAGLNAYLGKEYDNLLTCEVVCHGVPVGLAWEKYIKELEEQKGKKVKNVIFRDKSLGWMNNQYRIEYDDESVEYELSIEHIFHKGYLNGLFYRPSCGQCIFARLPRAADVTLADYWQYKGNLLKHVEDGVSLVVINSKKGHYAFEKTSAYMKIDLTNKQNAINSCRHLTNTPEENPKRSEFIQRLKKDGFFAAMKESNL